MKVSGGFLRCLLAKRNKFLHRDQEGHQPELFVPERGVHQSNRDICWNYPSVLVVERHVPILDPENLLRGDKYWWMGQISEDQLT